MSKRTSWPASPNDVFKKPKLDVRSSTSTSTSTEYGVPADKFNAGKQNWGDDVDDEILLMASQAFETVETTQESIGSYANENRFMSESYGPPSDRPSTSNSKSGPGDDDFEAISASYEFRSNRPSTSNSKLGPTYNEFKAMSESYGLSSNRPSTSNFKLGPTYGEIKTMSESYGLPSNRPSTSNSKLGPVDDESEAITYASSVSNLAVNEHVQNLIKQLNAIKKENEKLKTEHESSINKYLTKDGEVSILRMQLKNAQSQVAAIKREKVKYQEVSQIEWTDKLKTANNEIQSCKSQLQFRSLEIANLKEKCKLLETSKIKFVEPTNPGFDHSKWVSFSQKPNLNISKVESKPSITTLEMGTQIDGAPDVIKLITLNDTGCPLMKSIHESFFNHSPIETPIIFNSNKSSRFVENSNFAHLRKKILEEYNCRKTENKDCFLENLKLDCIYQDVAKLRAVSANNLNSEEYLQNTLKILLITKLVLIKVFKTLDKLNNKLTLLNVREMDEKYIEFSGKELELWLDKSIFDGKSWFENEQAIDARRAVGVLASLCKYIKSTLKYVSNAAELNNHLVILREMEPTFKATDYNKQGDCILTLLSKICQLIGKIGCSNFYIGFLTSVCYLLETIKEDIIDSSQMNPKVYSVVREILLLRPHAKLMRSITAVLKELCLDEEILKLFCTNSAAGNLLFNYNEGVVLYNNETCTIQLLCNNIEVWTKLFFKIRYIEEIFLITGELMQFRQNGKKMNSHWEKHDTQKSCLCYLKIKRCLCLCLYKCATLYEEHIGFIKGNFKKKLNATLRTGIMILNFYIINDIEFTSHLGEYEGYYQIFVMTCRKLADQLQLQDIHRDALKELSDSITAVSENAQNFISKSTESWEKCFDNFSLNE